MRGFRIIRSNLSRLSIRALTHLDSVPNEPTHIPNPAISAPTLLNSLSSIKPLIPFSSFSTLNTETLGVSVVPKDQEGCSSDSDKEENNEYDNDGKPLGSMDEGLARDAKTVLDVLRKPGYNPVELRNKIEQCGVKASRELVSEVLSRVRNDWEAAFTFFLWAGRQPGYAHSVHEYHSMIVILGKMRKFDTAWSLIEEMRGCKTGVSLVTPQTLMIMIRRYCAVRDVGKAIHTFYAYKRFKFDLGIDEFQGLLSALCRYKNVQEAEHLMFCNKDVFPFETKSFNIVLNGWCNVIGSPREAERVWREMCRRRIQYDVVSYSCIMSCYSKAGNLHKVLNLYNRMRGMGIEPDRKVYDAVIHALAKARMVKEATNLLKAMEENGITPNILTYNSLIKPLCRARMIDEAKSAFDEMLHRGISPTIHTYHVFFRMLRTGEEVFQLLEKMRELGCPPTNDTYIMLIRKFCRWRELDNVNRLWNEMIESGLSLDVSSYIVLIHGLLLNGKSGVAYKYYMEMKEKQLLSDPKIDVMLQTWLSNKQRGECEVTELRGNQLDDNQSDKQVSSISNRSGQVRNSLKQAEAKRVVRELGFSFREE